VEAVLATFLGTRMQTPPRYSAVKVAGRPLYEYARKGQEVEAKARPVRIDAMELVSLDLPRLRVIMRCSRGTYARVLAEEIGEALGTVGHLEELRRTRSGPFLIDHAVPLSRLSEIVAGDPAWDRVLRPARGEERVPWRPREQVFGGLEPFLTSPREALRHLPALTLSPIESRRFRQTGAVPPAPPGVTGAYLLLEGDEILGVGSTGSSAAVPLASEQARGQPPASERRERRH
jgi:tRNA U55 pseudouridine synthase TruB